MPKNSTFITFSAVSIALLASMPVVSFSQQRPLKVMLLYDMEGVSEVSDVKQTQFVHADEYAQGRKALTADVNAAIAGLKAAGATEIVVVDGHGSGNSTGPDILEDQIQAPARILYKDAPFDIYMDSYDNSMDAIIAIGMHPGAGNSAGFLSHTYSTQDVDYRVNGIPVNESMILAMGAARLKIPLIMVSGDDQLEKEVQRNLPWVRYAMVKHAVSRSKAEPLARAEINRRIEATAREALAALGAAKLPDLPGPYRFAVTFQDAAQANNAALLPGAELVNARTVQVRSNDFEEGYRRSIRLISLGGAIARATAAQAVLRAQPSLRTAVTDWSSERWLDPTFAPPEPAPARRRYWGAQ
jgi:D-amino peptidase